jgi:hypothetical protein
MICSRRVLSIVFAVLSALAVGTASVHASPACQQLVGKYVEKMVPNRVSPATAARWRAWNKTHPNFRPKPRPQYKLTSEEVTRKMEFDCQLPVDPVMLALEIPPQMPADPPTDLFPPPTLRTVVLAKTAISTLPLTALAAPPTPANIAPVPEPSSLVFVLTGFAFLVAYTGVWKIKRSSAAGSHTRLV